MSTGVIYFGNGTQNRLEIWSEYNGYIGIRYFDDKGLVTKDQHIPLDVLINFDKVVMALVQASAEKLKS